MKMSRRDEVDQIGTEFPGSFREDVPTTGYQQTARVVDSSESVTHIVFSFFGGRDRHGLLVLSFFSFLLGFSSLIW